MSDDDKLRHARAPGNDSEDDPFTEFFERYAVRGEHLKALWDVFDFQKRIGELVGKVPTPDPPDPFERQRRRLGRKLFEHVIMAVSMPTEDYDRWLDQADALLRDTEETQRVRIVEAVRERDIEGVRLALSKAGCAEAYDIADETILNAFDRYKGSRGLYPACAELSIDRVFHDRKRPDELTRETAIQRIANYYGTKVSKKKRKKQT